MFTPGITIKKLKHLRRIKIYKIYLKINTNKHPYDFCPELHPTLYEKFSYVYNTKVPQKTRWLIEDMIKFATIIGVNAIFYAIMMKQQRGALVPAQFKLAKPNEIDTTFDSIIGAEKAKAETHEFLNFVKNPQKYTDMGVNAKKGCIFYGPPGTGKTELARW